MNEHKRKLDLALSQWKNSLARCSHDARKPAQSVDVIRSGCASRFARAGVRYPKDA